VRGKRDYLLRSVDGRARLAVPPACALLIYINCLSREKSYFIVEL